MSDRIYDRNGLYVGRYWGGVGVGIRYQLNIGAAVVVLTPEVFRELVRVLEQEVEKMEAEEG